jgi:hypothetical protein
MIVTAKYKMSGTKGLLSIRNKMKVSRLTTIEITNKIRTSIKPTIFWN